MWFHFRGSRISEISAGVLHFAHFSCKKEIEIVFVTSQITQSASKMTQSRSQPKYSLGEGLARERKLRAAACGCISGAPASPGSPPACSILRILGVQKGATSFSGILILRSAVESLGSKLLSLVHGIRDSIPAFSNCFPEVGDAS